MPRPSEMSALKSDLNLPGFESNLSEKSGYCSVARAQMRKIFVVRKTEVRWPQGTCCMQLRFFVFFPEPVEDRNCVFFLQKLKSWSIKFDWERYTVVTLNDIFLRLLDLLFLLAFLIDAFLTWTSRDRKRRNVTGESRGEANIDQNITNSSINFKICLL